MNVACSVCVNATVCGSASTCSPISPAMHTLACPTVGKVSCTGQSRKNKDSVATCVTSWEQHALVRGAFAGLAVCSLRFVPCLCW